MDRESIVISMILLLLILTFTLFSFGTFTGVVTAATNTTTGNVSVSITTVTQINFTTNALAFGAGSVNAGATQAELTSLGSGAVTNGSWSANGGELVLENIGSLDVALDIVSNINATTLIDGTNPAFQWNVSEGQASSCVGDLTLANASGGNTWANVNITGDGTRFCTTFDATDASDQLKIDFRLVIPSDTNVSGSRSAVITAKGTSA